MGMGFSIQISRPLIDWLIALSCLVSFALHGNPSKDVGQPTTVDHQWYDSRYDSLA
jgi:hypothetical protein